LAGALLEEDFAMISKRQLLAQIAFVAVLMLVSGVALAAGGGGNASFSEINWWKWDAHKLPLGWFIVDFIIFVGLLVHFVKKPMAAAFANRHQLIKKTIADNEKAHAQARQTHDEYQSKLANVDAEGNALIERSKADGALERDKLIEDATAYGERIKGDSTAIVDQELTQAGLRLQAFAALGALKDAEERLQASITDGDQTRLLEEAIKELETSSSAGGAA
jgi:F0F1-type ATP synthase membrane subunit b/b'